MENCGFPTEVTFLGFNIGPQGVGMEENRVSAVSEWPEPDLVKALQRFLGLANFYQRLIKRYSTMRPLLFFCSVPSAL